MSCLVSEHILLVHVIHVKDWILTTYSFQWHKPSATDSFSEVELLLKAFICEKVKDQLQTTIARDTGISLNNFENLLVNKHKIET